ncbi:MAG: hypothetical protein ACRCXC_07640 [Legionella sp.]
MAKEKFNNYGRENTQNASKDEVQIQSAPGTKQLSLTSGKL